MSVTWIDLWEGSTVPRWPGHLVEGMPTFGFRLAPPGTATRRQLRADKLCPGGREPFGKLVWKRGRRFAWLFVVDHARSSRIPSSSQLQALDNAMTVRRTCAAGHVAGHCVRLSDRLCGDHAFEAEQARMGVAA